MLRLIAGLVWLAACAPPAPTAAPIVAQATHPPRPTHTPAPTIEPYALQPSATPPPIATPADLSFPTPLPPDVNPLTGLKVPDPSLLDRRPLVIKVTNFPRSVRPQWGLMAADHVWEYFLEDELTRFVGIFYGTNTERVGPIRSARPFDEHLVRMYKGIFVFGYADDRVIDPWVQGDMAPYLVIEKPDNCPPLCRIGSENDYNTLYGDTALISQYAAGRGTNNQRQQLHGLHFDGSPLALQGGRDLSQVNIRFSPMSYNYWKYDPAIGRYLRWQDAERALEGEESYEPLMDSQTGQQIAADNVVVLFIPTSYYFVSRSTEIYEHNLVGSGDGYALRDGHIFAIRWKREYLSDLLSLTVAGSPYPLKPGTVWFEVLNTITTKEIDLTTWQFTFDLPLRPTLTPKPSRTPKPTKGP